MADRQGIVAVGLGPEGVGHERDGVDTAHRLEHRGVDDVAAAKLSRTISARAEAQSGSGRW